MRITLRNIEDSTDSLWRASYAGNLNKVDWCLKRNPQFEERASARRCTALHAAALMGHHEVVEKLLSYQKGTNKSTNVRQANGPHSSGITADVNARDIDGFTPLQYAVSRLMTKTVAILIKFNGDVSSLDKPDFAPVWIAATAIYHDPDVDYGDSPGERTVELQDARLAMVKTLLVAGARLEYFQWGGANTTIWELAIESRKDTRLLQLLLKYGWADPPIKPDGDTIAHCVTKLPLWKCIAGADCDMLKLLDREQFDAENNNGETPLFWAIKNNKVRTVKIMLYVIKVTFKYNDLVSISRLDKQHIMSAAMTDVIKTYLESIPEGRKLP